jgi:hypothetical protein
MEPTVVSCGELVDEGVEADAYVEGEEDELCDSEGCRMLWAMSSSGRDGIAGEFL